MICPCWDENYVKKHSDSSPDWRCGGIQEQYKTFWPWTKWDFCIIIPFCPSTARSWEVLGAKLQTDHSTSLSTIQLFNGFVGKEHYKEELTSFVTLCIPHLLFLYTLGCCTAFYIDILYTSHQDNGRYHLPNCQSLLHFNYLTIKRVTKWKTAYSIFKVSGKKF